jgi:hypothetical protein
MSKDVQVMLNMIRQQLNWLERELAMLHQALGQPSSPESSPPTFESLGGVWAGVSFSDEDLQASRLRMPQGL